MSRRKWSDHFLYDHAYDQLSISYRDPSLISLLFLALLLSNAPYSKFNNKNQSWFKALTLTSEILKNDWITIDNWKISQKSKLKF